MQDGDIEIGLFCPYGSLVPGGTINWMNWTVENWDEGALAYSPDGGILFELMTDAWAEVGAHMLCEYQLGAYGLGNNVRPITTPDDFENLKFRVGGTTSYIRCMENMGEGTGLTLELLPWVELYGALEKGVVDGCWNLWPTLVENRFYEVMDYYTALGFGWDTNQVLINKELWDGLPADIRDIITKASRISEQRDYAAHRTSEIANKKALLDAGMEIYTPNGQRKGSCSGKRQTCPQYGTR